MGTMAALDEAAQNRRVLVCCGSGGVGKTTTSAALGLRAAQLGRRACVLTIDPAHRLADALGLEKLDNTPREVPASAHGGEGSLHALMLDTKDTFDDLVARLIPDPERRERLLTHPMYRVMGRGLAGSMEYMAVERLYALAVTGEYDLVVLDTPPAQNALDFMEAPGLLMRIFDPRIMRYFAPTEEEQQGLGGRLLVRGIGVVKRLLGAFLGEELTENVYSFFEAFRDLNDPVFERGTQVRELLMGSDSGFIVVTGPDPVRIREAVALRDELRERKVRLEGYVVNRVQPHLGETSEAVEPDALAPLVQHLPDAERASAATTLLEGLRENYRRYEALAHRDHAGVQRLREAVGKGSRIWVVPQVAEARDVTGILAMLREHLFEGAQQPA